MAVTPFTLSLARTLAMGVDGVPEMAVPVSGLGAILAVTVIVAVLFAQFGDVSLSHNV